MKDKKILFITYDLSGYYDSIHNQLNKQYKHVDYYNIASLKKYKYKHIFEKAYAAIYKLFTKNKLKNYYKLQPIIEATAGKTYDYILIVRPDLFFDSQLSILKSKTKNFIAYYHDSINNITRKKEVIPFFDKVYSYEKKDVKDYNLKFLPNFIYLNQDFKKTVPTYDAFTIMSKDFRFNTLKKLATYLKKKQVKYEFLVQSDKKTESKLIHFIQDRKNNKQVLEYLLKTNIIVDIHKYGVQDGLTFRVFESLFLEKKLITTNADIKTYDFYNPNNIHVIEPDSEIHIPKTFLNTPYQPIPSEIYQKYHYTNWLKTILS
ncbi:hypothetical protein KO494_14105 [Lacinutrix sp. C3R15]|uniref:hypothetical protein n=1 Tax=Flavobacteriaceae TaxID=49546 RepID=UPI001C08F5F4|nr:MULTISPECIES: hypothetical protein [Flavobacteriaceae]MBU2940677.1 hypothetical protein [Lacinutrix sp. C3R15]MDO6623995.1 hypothetical protein [Oceanihabitans sp. 1_MG-2023]